MRTLDFHNKLILSYNIIPLIIIIGSTCNRLCLCEYFPRVNEHHVHDDDVLFGYGDEIDCAFALTLFN